MHSLIFMMELCLQHGFQQQQCEDTLSFPPSHEVKGRPPNGTTSSACWAPSHPVTHTHTLLKILDTLNNPFSPNRNVLFLWRLLASSVCSLFPPALLSELWDDVTSLIRGKLYRPTSNCNFTTNDIKESFYYIHSKQCVSVCECLIASYLEACVGPRMAEVVESPWLRRVHRFPLEVGGHTISPRELEYAHGDGTLLPGYRDKWKGRMTQREKEQCDRGE